MKIEEIVPFFTDKDQNCKNCGYCYGYTTDVWSNMALKQHRSFCIKMFDESITPNLRSFTSNAPYYQHIPDGKNLKLTCSEFKESLFKCDLSGEEILNSNLINALYFYYRENEGSKNE